MTKVLMQGEFTKKCKNSNCTAVLIITAENLTGGYPDEDFTSRGDFCPAVICEACGGYVHLQNISHEWRKLAEERYQQSLKVPAAQVKEGSFEIVLTCNSCKGKAAFSREDIYAAYFGGELRYYVYCPLCQTDLFVSNISFIVQEEAKKRSQTQ